MTLTPARSSALALLAATAALTLAGCHVSSNKDGKNENVDIGTPFGSMSVKTNDKVDGSSIGLAVYPGATPIKDKDNEAADVNMSFGSFHLGVKAATYETPDKTDKVIAFYRKDLAKYGDVIACEGHTTVGKPERTAEGLTCSESDRNHISTSDHSSNDLELRAGSPQKQHIVGVETKDGKTHIGLVMLTLPVQVHSHGDQQSE